MKKDNFLNKGIVILEIIITCAGIITKVIEFVYRVSIANILGYEGNGIYSVALGIYDVAFILTSYSLLKVVSSMIADRIRNEKFKSSYKTLRCAFVFALIVGSTVSILLFFGAKSLENLYARQGLAYPLKILAPTILVVSFLGVFRGFYEAFCEINLTELSQIVEQIIIAFIGIFVPFILMKNYSNIPNIPMYSAAGSALGVLMGALVTLIIFIVFFLRNKTNLICECVLDKHTVESKLFLYKTLISTLVPLMISYVIYQLLYTVDDLMFGRIMLCKLPEETITELLGIFDTQYIQIINLPIYIASYMVLAYLPYFVFSFISVCISEVQKNISLMLKSSMLIVIPSAFSLAVLSKPIISVLFPKLSEYSSLASSLLLFGSSAIIFYSISNITILILQSIERIKIHVRNSSIALALHIVVICLLMKYTNLSIYALLIGNIIFPLVISILNFIFIKKRISYIFEYKKIFIYPTIASIAMSVVLAITYNLIFSKIISNWLALLLTMIVGISVYLLIIIKLGCFAYKSHKVK